MRLALFLLLAATASGYAYYVYVRLELPVRSARRLAVVRGTVLVLILALLFDPRIPGDAGPSAGQRWVLLDASRSMAPGWDQALDEVSVLEAQGWRVVTFGDAIQGAGSDQAPQAQEGRTLLAPALQRAAEAGVREVVVVSDLRFEDPVQVRAELSALPLNVVFRQVTAGSVNAGAASFAVPDAPRPGDARVATLDVFGFGADSLDVEVREEGRLVATDRLAVPSPGLRLPVQLELPPPAMEGRVRYTASVTVVGDDFADDDEAVDYATVGGEEGALVLVSFQPDWEPRYLLPVLTRVTGLSPRGYLRVGPDQYMPMGRAVERGDAVDSATVRAAVSDAALVVVHGVAGRLTPWERSLVARAGGRSLVFPVDAGGAGLVAVDAMAPRAGEWYAAQEIPPSSMAGDLAGLQLQGLPPLNGLMPLAGTTPGEVPLHAQLAGTGAGEAVLVLGRRGGGRQAVALAAGFWRWAAREGAPRQAYRALWSGVAGWLLRSEVAGPVADPRPTRWVFGNRFPVSFQLPGDSAQTLAVSVTGGDSVLVDTVLTGGGVHTLGPLPPGLYGYAVRGPDGVEIAQGRFDVSAGSQEMLPARFAAPGTSGDLRGTPGVDAPQGRPLRTLPWPYLLIILLLCAEWVARRRTGLR